MRGLAKFRWYIFGDKFLYQKEGIPIGGPVSGAILEGVLSVDEHVFEQFGWKVFADSLGIRGTREQWLSLARYVDDVFAHSFWFCPECVEYIITLIYKQTVNFDKACEGLEDFNGFRTIKFLDQWCYTSWHTTYLSFVCKNVVFPLLAR